jgi:hypothetical protein
MHAGISGFVAGLNEDLSVQSVLNAEPEGIIQMGYLESEDCFLLRTTEGRIKRVDRNSSQQKSRQPILPILAESCDFCIREPVILTISKSELLGWNFRTEKMVLRESVQLAMMNLSDNKDYLVGINNFDVYRNENPKILIYSIFQV